VEAAVTEPVPAPPAPDAALLPALLDAAPVGFAFVDPRRQVVYVNERLAEATGLQPGDVLDGARHGFAADADRQVRAVLADERPRNGAAIDRLDADGRPTSLATSWYPVRDPVTAGVVGVAVVATDVTRLVRVADEQRQAALTLQRALLPAALPVSEELETAVRYAAGGETEVGGDFYDVIALGGGRIALAVGDVMGRGVHAAAVMGQLRTAVRTCARLELRPAEVLDLLDGLVADLAPSPFDVRIATCVYAVFDPCSRELQLAVAGHLAPVVRTPAGGVERLDVEVSAPLGLGDPATETRVRLQPGSVLALFTDGLVERRGSDLDRGLDALCRALSTGPDDVDALADAVLGALVGRDAHDDVALLLARVPADIDTRSRTVVIPVSRERALLIDVRSQARAAMASWALLEEVVDTATLLASELVTNGLVHGRGGVELRVRLTRDRLVLEAEDAGHHMPRRRRAGIDEEGGRGLHLVATLADRWGARQTDDGKVVWAELDLAVAR
jgi:anti-sigma regulatory factor (Ser/Thr protein kinase)